MKIWKNPQASPAENFTLHTFQLYQEPLEYFTGLRNFWAITHWIRGLDQKSVKICHFPFSSSPSLCFGNSWIFLRITENFTKISIESWKVLKFEFLNAYRPFEDLQNFSGIFSASTVDLTQEWRKKRFWGTFSSINFVK